MNENLNLAEILKDCPFGTKLYSPVYGDVELVEVRLNSSSDFPIEVRLSNNSLEGFTLDGRLNEDFNGECMLFPNKDQRDWSKFNIKKPKFDPKTLKPFDKVLVQGSDSENWMVQLFSYIMEGEKYFPYACIAYNYKYCIPYNDDTKHLIGTKEEAPEFYRHWED